MRTTNRGFQAMAAIVSMALVSGCAEPEAARDMATHTAATLATYEKQVNDKVLAEKGFYKKEVAEIRRFLTGEVNLGTLGTKDGDDSKLRPVERSLVYGRIVNGTNRDARLAAEAMIYARKVDVMGRAIAFVKRGIDDDLALYRELSERRTALQESLIKELAKIDQQKARLAKVKNGLAKLSKSSDPADRFKLVKKHAEVIKKAIEAMSDQ